VQSVFTARRYANALYAVVLCPSMSVLRPFVCQVGVLSKRLYK